MSKNPFANAFAAALYIIIIASVMDYGTRQIGPVKSVIAPIAVVSLFTLSAAVMAYIFLYQPFQIYFDGKKKEAVNLFIQTVAVFSAITAVILIVLFSGILA